MTEINGEWIGFYASDFADTDGGPGRKVPFRLTVQRGIREFVGRIIEEPDFGGIEDEIAIRGVLDGDEIQFTKHYTKAHFLGENDELVSVESEDPTVVYYTGRFDASAQKFVGTWELPVLREDDEGVFHEENDTGSWEIWRE